MAVLAIPVVQAQTAEQPTLERQAVDSRHELAEVVVDGWLVMEVRGTGAFPAARRAAEVEQKIVDIARDESFSPDAITIRELGDRTLLMAGEVAVVDVFDTDAAIEGFSREVLAKVWQERLQEVIAGYRRDRTPNVLLMHSLYGLLALAAAVAVILLLRRAFRLLGDLLKRRLEAHIRELEAISASLIRSYQVAEMLRGLLRAAYVVLLALTVYFTLNFVLGLYPWTRGFSIWLFGLILTPLSDMGNAFLDTIPDLAWLAVLYFITRYVLGMLRAFFRGLDTGAIELASFEREWAWPTYRIVRMLVIILALVVAYPHIPGSDSEAFKGISVLVGLIVSLGSSSIIGNIIAGYSLTYRRLFRIGDWVKIDDTIGEVTEIKVLTTRLRSLKNEEVVVPNTNVQNGQVINFSTLARDKGLILSTTVGIGYDTPWRQVEAMLKEAAGRTPGLLGHPQPFVLSKDLGDFAVTYELNVYCDDPGSMGRTYSALHSSIMDVFNDHGVAIMTPTYMSEPPPSESVPRDEWYAERSHRPAEPGPS